MSLSRRQLRVNRRAVLALAALPLLAPRRERRAAYHVRNIVLGWDVLIISPKITGGPAYGVVFQHNESKRRWAHFVTQQELYTRRWSVETWAKWMIPRLNMSPVVEV